MGVQDHFDSLDFVVSMYGAMFAPRPDVVSRELVRVCKSGGRIAMTNWTPDSFIGRSGRGELHNEAEDGRVQSWSTYLEVRAVRE